MVAYLTRPRQKYENGGPVIPEPKPEEAIHAGKLKDFEAKVNLGVQGIRGGMEKDLIIQMLEEQKDLIGLSNEDARMVISNFMGRLNRGLKAEGGRAGFSKGSSLEEEYYGKQKLDWMKNYPDLSWEEYLRFKSSGSFADGGRIVPQLVRPTIDGSRPGYSGREYSQKNINQLSDDLLKAYAEDDITHLMDPKHRTSLSDIRINRRSTLDKAIKNTGLDEETIFNLLDDRDAFQELELNEDLWKRGRKVDPDKAKFYKQAENWIVKNSKRYADPDKFKKAFIRTFGKDNHLIQKINKPEVLGKRGSTLTSVPFSDWFRTNIMGSSEQAMRGQVKPSYSAKQLDHIFKTAIYTNNENVRNKIIKELTDILPEKGSKRIPDIRLKFQNSPILKKFGLNQRIDGPIARLLAKEVGDDLLKQVSLFRKPWLGTSELLTYLKDRVNPKYKSMFEETSKAVLYAQKNQWPEAKKALNISESVMFDHKIPKALIEAGYADDIEYIKLNPTSAEFNAKIKNTQFDQPMVRLIDKWEKAKTVDAKSKVVGEMNTLKDKFSKKYGNYLDDVKINVDKTGKPIFSSKTPVVTKKTDLVKSLKTSLQQQKGIVPELKKAFKKKGIKITNSQAGFIANELLGDIAKVGGKVLKGAGVVGGALEPAFAAMNFSEAIDAGLSGKESGLYTVGKFGEDVANIPGILWGAKNYLKDKFTGQGEKAGPFDYLPTKPKFETLYDATFARDWMKKRVDATPEDVKQRRIAERDFDTTVLPNMTMVDDIDMPAPKEEIETAKETFLEERGIKKPLFGKYANQIKDIKIP